MLTTEKRAALQKPFDIRPCHGCTLDDLVLELFSVGYLPAAVDRDVIAENQRDIPEQMASLRLYDLAADCPTNAAALLFAKDPLRWVAGAYVQFVRWAGTTMADDPISAKSFSGDLLGVLREVASLVALQAESYPVAETALRERPEIDYPPVAIREILMNAIMHRSYESNAPVQFYWYEDRIDIQSPGGLYGMASPENFPRQTDYRNPVIAEAMATLGYVNHFGRGVIRAQEALRRNGNPEATFTFDPSHVLATIESKPWTAIAFFNNKGGVGKTTLAYHLSWMYADLGVSVVVADLDPQANLTTMFLSEDRLEELWPDGDHPHSILGSISPIMRGLGDISTPHVEECER